MWMPIVRLMSLGCRLWLLRRVRLGLIVVVVRVRIVLVNCRVSVGRFV